MAPLTTALRPLRQRFWAGIQPGGSISAFDITSNGDGFMIAIDREQSMEPPRPVKSFGKARRRANVNSGVSLVIPLK